MRYENQAYKKTKNSFRLLVLCSQCKEEVLEYEKVGRGALLRLYPSRIVRSSMDLGQEDKAIKCSNCRQILAIRKLSKKAKGPVYTMLRNAYNLKKL